MKTYELIIIRDFSEMIVAAIYDNKSHDEVWDIANETYETFDVDVLTFYSLSEMNEFLDGEIPKK